MSLKPYYQAHGITIYHRDCREVLAHLDRASVDLIVTDPPYGISYQGGRTGKHKPIAGDDDLSLRDFVIEWGRELPMIIFGSWKRSRPAQTRGVLIWDKGPAFGMNGASDMPWKLTWEEVYIIGRGFHGHRDEGIIKGLYPPYNCLKQSHGQRFHPTQKPGALLYYLLSKAPPGRVLDPFMGAGSTLLAAHKLGREAIGIELEEEYCAAAVKRLELMRHFTK